MRLDLTTLREQTYNAGIYGTWNEVTQAGDINWPENYVDVKESTLKRLGLLNDGVLVDVRTIPRPGTVLAENLKSWGMLPSPGCKCAKYVQDMNDNGAVWCQENVEIIVGWLEESAKEMKEKGELDVEFSRFAAKLLVKDSIASSIRQANKFIKKSKKVGCPWRR